MNEETVNKKFPWVWVVIAVVVLVVAGWFFTRKGDKKMITEEHTVARQDLVIKILATGMVKPENRLEIKAPIPGRIEKVLTKEGAVVKKGQILAWMSSTERAALLDAAMAKGAAEVQRWEGLYKSTPIMAPINGTLILKSVEAGQTITSNDAIFVMSDRLTVKAQVDETDIAQIKSGQQCEIILDAYPQEKIEAYVDQVAFDANTVNNVTSYVVDVVPKSTPDYFRSGMTANVTFQIRSKKDVLSIPQEAVKTVGEKQVVLVKENSNSVEREVELGLSDGKMAEVKSGLKEGDIVLTFRPDFQADKKSTSPFSPMGRPKSNSGSSRPRHP